MIVYHLVYLTLTIVIMITVARTLAKGGRVFLIEVFGNTDTADAVNRLLVVGFCVTKIGYAALAIRWAGRPQTLLHAGEMLSHRIGIILLLLGLMHCVNLILLCLWQRHLSKVKAFLNPADDQ